ELGLPALHTLGTETEEGPGGGGVLVVTENPQLAACGAQTLITRLGAGGWIGNATVENNGEVCRP
ncbi:MAG: hypothetical protein ACI9WU_004172, partial [Myxococcota bacterium]